MGIVLKVCDKVYIPSLSRMAVHQQTYNQHIQVTLRSTSRVSVLRRRGNRCPCPQLAQFACAHVESAFLDVCREVNGDFTTE